ncbi:MAG: rhodanese-like domain-containing protein [Halarcobacter sp.]
MFTKLISMIFAIVLLGGSIYAQDMNLKSSGVTIEFDGKSYTIKRMHDKECKTINGADPDNIWSGNYANEKLPSKCIKKFVTTVGKITPIQINDNIKTIGELEVIKFIKESQTDKNKLLIDARLPAWHALISIPTATNIPFTYFNKVKYPFKFYDVLDLIGVDEISEDKYDFSNAKDLVLFCNGAWCPQSTLAIENLIKIGYPQDKIKWYRGGMYSWKMLNLTTVPK